MMHWELWMQDTEITNAKMPGWPRPCLVLSCTYRNRDSYDERVEARHSPADTWGVEDKYPLSSSNLKKESPKIVRFPHLLLCNRPFTQQLEPDAIMLGAPFDELRHGILKTTCQREILFVHCGRLSPTTKL